MSEHGFWVVFFGGMGIGVFLGGLAAFVALGLAIDYLKRRS